MVTFIGFTPTTTGRGFNAAVDLAPVAMAGCLLSVDEGYRLSPDTVGGEYLHLVADGVERTMLDLVDIERDDEGWIRVELRYDGRLDEYLELPDEIDVTTPLPP